MRFSPVLLCCSAHLRHPTIPAIPCKYSQRSRHFSALLCSALLPLISFCIDSFWECVIWYFMCG